MKSIFTTYLQQLKKKLATFQQIYKKHTAMTTTNIQHLKQDKKQDTLTIIYNKLIKQNTKKGYFS